MTPSKNESDSSIHGGSQTVRRAFELLRLVACGQEAGVRLKDLVEISGLNRPTVHRLLKTLIEESAVEQDISTKRYRICRDLALLGLARTRKLALQVSAETYQNNLAETIGDTVFLSIRDRLDSVCILRRTGSQPIQVLSIEVGVRRPLGRGVSGIVLLSCLNKNESDQLIKANSLRLIKLGDCITDISHQVLQARKLGYAFRASGIMPLTSAVSVPLIHPHFGILGALTTTAMANRLPKTRIEEVVSVMQKGAEMIVQRYSEIATHG